MQYDMIKFRRQPAESLRKLIIDLPHIFQILVGKSGDYETDYIARIRL